MKASLKSSVHRLNILSQTSVLFCLGCLVLIGSAARADQPTEKELIPLVEELSRSSSFQTVPAHSPTDTINSVDAKILKIEEPKAAIDREGGKVIAEYKVWPVRVFVVLSLTRFGRESSSKGEGIYYAYEGRAHNGAGVTDPQGKWTLTAVPPEIKKSGLDLLKESISGKEKKP